MPNSVFAFAPCFGSWHAVPKMGGKGFVRNTIQTFLMVWLETIPNYSYVCWSAGRTYAVCRCV